MDRKLKPINYVLQGLMLVSCIFIDQLTKVWARNDLKNNPVVVIKNVFCFNYLENRGSIWGIMQGKVDLLLIFSFVIYVVLVYCYIKIPKIRNYNFLLWIDVLMFAGAIGNTIDRIFFGYVTDFIYVEIINFPIFNFADCCITVSCALTIILLLTKYRQDEFKFLSLKKKASKSETDTEDGQSNIDN